MSELKHTPGPWVAQVDPDGKNLDVTSGDGVMVVNGCGCCGSPFMEGPAKENAHLIAAAPDMLEELEWVLIDLSENNTLGDDRRQSIRAAIAKAKGE